MDTRDWARLRAQFTEDVLLDHPQIGRHQGAVVVVAAIRDGSVAGPPCTTDTTRTSSSPRRTPPSGTGRCTASASRTPPRRPGGPPDSGGSGDEFRRTPDGWRIAAVSLRHQIKGVLWEQVRRRDHAG
ncbi:nuclear transport factor 2 family protein [Pseudonocardia sp. NPDC049154]|uniref:nuclear transport factor 2 family protein n=1 Tax=Pseudonocardia sp. NPDC049154 TaxID=3155501 RepID=UPI0033DD65A9